MKANKTFTENITKNQDNNSGNILKRIISELEQLEIYSDLATIPVPVFRVGPPGYFTHMAGFRINYQKKAIAVTMIIATAFKICISH